MADVGSAELEPGTIVRCTTNLGQEFEGEVAAFDLSKKAMVLSCPPTEGSEHKHNTIHLINLERLNQLQALQEPQEREAYKLSQLPSLDTDKLSKRVKDNIRQKRADVEKVGVNVTPKAQALFDMIGKTIDDTKWDGKTIVVMGGVFISEPYTTDSIRGRKESIEHISKLVAKFHEDLKDTNT